MTDGQWIGVMSILGGCYFAGCSVWGRSFFLYKLKVQRIAGFFGEKFAHGFYLVARLILLVNGVIRLIGIF